MQTLNRFLLKARNLREEKSYKSELQSTDYPIRLRLYIRTCQAAVQSFIDISPVNSVKGCKICARQ